MQLLIASACLLALMPAALGQSLGPWRSGPASAKLSQTSRNDPYGLTALLNELGFPQQYLGMWPYEFPLDSVSIDPSIDPAVISPIPGNVPSQNGSYRVVGNTGLPTAHALPFANELVLFMIRPNLQLNAGPDTHLQTYGGDQNYTAYDYAPGKVETEYYTIYNLTDNTFEPFYMRELAFCGAQTLLPDGRGIIAGGLVYGANYPYSTIGAQSVRIFDPQHQNYSQVAVMQTLRWYPSIMTMPSGNMLIIGGAQAETGNWGINQQPTTTMTNGPTKCSPNQGGGFSDPHQNSPSYQFFYPGNNSVSVPLTLAILLEGWPVNTYPFVQVLPSGSVLVVSGAVMAAYYLTEEEATPDTAIGDLPDLPTPVNYPQWGGFAMLPLSGPDYKAQFLIAGSGGEYCSGAMTPAGQQSWFFDTTPGADHSLVTEQLHSPRVMADLTILADGTLFLSNGANTGVAGGTGPSYSSATGGVTVAEIYDPTKPVGQRWSIAGDSQIWRLYHSIAFLTRNAEVFISGSETTGEFRAQLYTPAYLQTGKRRPAISDTPPAVDYGQNFTFSYSNVTSLDRVVFHRLTGATHGVHFDQRQIVLDCESASGEATCSSPPNSSIAPPGQYYLFSAFDGVPSVAEYVALGMDTLEPVASVVSTNQEATAG